MVAEVPRQVDGHHLVSPRSPRASQPRKVVRNMPFLDRSHVRRSLPPDSRREESVLGLVQTSSARILLQAELERKKREEHQKELLEQQQKRRWKVQQECRLRMADQCNETEFREQLRQAEQLQLQVSAQQHFDHDVASDNLQESPLLSTASSASRCESKQYLHVKCQSSSTASRRESRQDLHVKFQSSSRQPLGDVSTEKCQSSSRQPLSDVSTDRNATLARLPAKKGQCSDGHKGARASEASTLCQKEEVKSSPPLPRDQRSELRQNLARQLSDKSRMGDVAEVRRLLKAGVAVNLPDEEHGYTPLHWAVTGRCMAVTQLLIDSGADLEACIPDMSTPLMLAADEGDLDLAQLLLENGAHPYQVDEDGFTAEVRCSSHLRAQFAKLIFTYSR